MKKILITIIAIVYPLIILELVLFGIKIKKYNTINEETTINEVVEDVAFFPLLEEPKIEIKPFNILETSISICTNKYATRIANSVIKESDNTGIPAYVIYSIIGAESDRTSISKIETESGNFNPDAQSSIGCVGLTQLSQSALTDYNNRHNTHLTLDEVMNIEKNIEIGLWHYNRYSHKVGDEDWTSLYIIYNVGFREFSKENGNRIYNDYSGFYEYHTNSWYYLNGKYPPRRGGCKFSELAEYKPVKRFNTYLSMYKETFRGC